MTQQVFLALYKGKRNINSPLDYAKRVVDFAVRKITHSEYSHCEIAIQISGNRFECYTASMTDGGVRKKVMPLPADKWDLIPISDPAIVLCVESLYTQTVGAKYDFLGATGVVLHNAHSKTRWFCSEWCAAALGLQKPQQYSPHKLALKINTLPEPMVQAG